jgi:thioredoxin
MTAIDVLIWALLMPFVASLRPRLIGSRRSLPLGLTDLVDASTSFSAAVAGSGYVVVDFYADWCGPCRIAAKTFKQVADEMESAGAVDFLKVNTEAHEDTVDLYGLKGLPVFAVFKDGKMVVKHEGNLGKDKLVDFIKKGIPDL